MAKATHLVNNPVILITGGTGFAGSHLVELLIKKKEQNIHVTSHSGKDPFVSTLIDKENVHKVNLTDKKETENLIKAVQPDQIYHLASISSVGDSFENAENVLNNNINLQLNLLNAIKKFVPHARFLSVTSADQYAMSDRTLDENSAIAPINPYGVSKAAQDMLAGVYSNLDLNIVRARPFNHIGERQKTNFAIPAFASQIAKIEKNKQNQLKVGNLSAIRDFTDVKDMVRAYHLLMQKGETGQAYNIGSGHGIKVSDVLETLLRLAKVKVTVKSDPDRMRPADNPFIVADNTKIAALGWHPEIPIDKTLERTLNYFRNSVGN
jgi:GDP-4-dehydro-6-deoxy-D-mannose reductase